MVLFKRRLIAIFWSSVRVFHKRTSSKVLPQPIHISSPNAVALQMPTHGESAVTFEFEDSIECLTWSILENDNTLDGFIAMIFSYLFLIAWCHGVLLVMLLMIKILMPLIVFNTAQWYLLVSMEWLFVTHWTFLSPFLPGW